MSNTQSGSFEAMTYGYPVSVLLSAPPDAAIKLANVGAVKLTLLAPNSTTPIANQRTITDGWTQDASASQSDTITWTVLQGDHDIKGRYYFLIAIDSEGGIKHLVTTGTYLVT